MNGFVVYPLLIYSLVENLRFFFNFFLSLFLFVSISKFNHFLEQYQFEILTKIRSQEPSLTKVQL